MQNVTLESSYLEHQGDPSQGDENCDVKPLMAPPDEVDLEENSELTNVVLDDSATCAICLQAYEHGDEICMSSNSSCCHVFHSECLGKWLLRHDDCPCCRQKYMIPPEDFKTTEGRPLWGGDSHIFTSGRKDRDYSKKPTNRLMLPTLRSRHHRHSKEQTRLVSDGHPSTPLFLFRQSPQHYLRFAYRRIHTGHHL